MSYRMSATVAGYWLLWVVLLWNLALPSYATPETIPEKIDDAALDAHIYKLFPTATRIETPDSEAPVWKAYQLNELLGYAYRSNDYVDLPGFSGDRVNLLIGLDLQGDITGIDVLHHHEPIFLHGLGPQPMLDFIAQYPGHKVSERIIVGHGDSSDDSATYFDGVTKATVSVIVINDTILSSALKVARARLEAFAQQAPAEVNPEVFTPLSWPQLLEQGLIKRWELPGPVLEEQLGQALDDYPFEGDEDTYPEDGITVFYAYLNPPTVGRNFLGEDEYQRVMDAIKPGQHVLAVYSQGYLDFIEDDFRPGTAPQRIGLTQNGLPLPLRDMNTYDPSEDALPTSFQGEPNVRLFAINGQTGFDPSAPMELNLNLIFARNPLIKDSAHYTDTYQLPAEFFTTVDIDANALASRPLWMQIWERRLAEILVLVAGLSLLTVMFFRQRWLTRHSRRTHLFRWGYLAFTLFFIGFYAQGQLSVVNIYTLLLEIYNGFSLDVFLLDPIIFILWVYTAISLILFGRGLFCGWLCPFGALQEAVAWVAEKCRIRQIKVPNRWHRRLIWLKYVILLGLVATAFVSLRLAEQLAEIEPFKTSITLVFVRYWPFVLYALLLLGAGLFIHKFYCRYLCPLGAGLAIAGKFHLFNWLDRRQECGSPCQLCRHRCGINAIRSDGRIDYNECIQCLECVVILRDDDQCAPARVAKRKSQESTGVVVLQPVKDV